MKYFPVKVVLFCILVTPLFYTGGLYLIEKSLNPVYHHKLENIIVGDSTALMEGSITIQDAVGKNIHAFLNHDPWIRFFQLNLEIFVSGSHDEVIYPMFDTMNINGTEASVSWDTRTVARNNYKVLNHGLKIKVNTRLENGTTGANLVLAFFSMISLSIFFIFYKKSSAMSVRDEQEKGEKIAEFVKAQKDYQQALGVLEKERTQLVENLKEAQERHREDLNKANINEEELFEEIISLESRLNENLELQQHKEQKIDELKGALQKYERRKVGKTRRESFEHVSKRLAAIYKNVTVNRKALSGFINLKEDLQIKAEEIIHQLNEDSSKVTIKRKVFSGKKHRVTSFEVLFAYNGRVYFRNLEGGRVEILVIGTKNSQDKDMDFLHKL